MAMKVKHRGTDAPEMWSHEASCKSCGSTLVIEPSDLDINNTRPSTGSPVVYHGVTAKCGACGATIDVPSVPVSVYDAVLLRQR